MNKYLMDVALKKINAINKDIGRFVDTRKTHLDACKEMQEQIEVLEKRKAGQWALYNKAKRQKT